MTQQPKSGLSPKAQALLDQVLEGESPEQRAKVLRLVLDMGIEPEEEFFALSLALKQLQVMMLDSPGQWQQQFSEFLGEVDTRSESGRQMLGALSGNLEIIASLADDVHQIRMNLEALSESAELLDQQFTQASMVLDRVIAQWQQGLAQWQHQRQQEARQNSELLKGVLSLKKALSRQPPAFLLRTSWSGIGMKVLVVYAIVVTGLLLSWMG